MSGSTGDAPVLEGEHRLGEGMRRGVFCLGLVPVATGLTLREAMWMQCCLTAGVEPGPMPAHAFRRADRHAVEDAMGVAPGLMRAMAADAKRRRRMVDADEEGRLPLGSPSPVDMMTRDFRVRPGHGVASDQHGACGGPVHAGGGVGGASHRRAGHRRGCAVA